MNSKSILKMAAPVMIATGMMILLAACQVIPKGTMAKTAIGSVTVHATGAGIVKADAQTVTFKIKCGLCGFEPEAITIPMPTPGKPYTNKWVCPKCGHKQTIVITVGSQS